MIGVAEIRLGLQLTAAGDEARENQRSARGARPAAACSSLCAQAVPRLHIARALASGARGAAWEEGGAGTKLVPERPIAAELYRTVGP